MTSSRRAVYAVAFGGWVMLAPRAARADVAASRLRLRYEVPAGCPSRSDFDAALESRIETSWVDGSDTRSFEVRVERLASGSFSGRLEIRQVDRPPSAREIRGESCRGVTTSLAVFLAIALDPSLDPPSDEVVTPPERDRGTPLPSRAPPDPRAPPPPTTTVIEKIPSTDPRAAWTFRAGYAVAYQRNSEPSWGGRAHAELTRGYERGRLASTLRLSWGWSDFSTFPPRAGEAKFRLRTVRLEAGPRFTLAPFVFTASVGLDVGALTAKTADLSRFVQLTTPWVAAAATLRAAASVSPWLAFELSAGVLVPFDRGLFVVQEPTRFVYRVPAAFFEGSAGIAAVARFR